MTYGFKIVEEMKSGLSDWMDEKGYSSIEDFRNLATPNVTDWQHLDLNYVAKAKIDQDLCISCGRCFAACEDTSHQAISMSDDRKFEVIDAECVACNLCVNVCPVEGCISMDEMQAGQTDPRTGKVVEDKYANWTTHPNNPMANLEPAE
jgi:dihydropyrimidine dehydrogenase (NAD+) subunit PreA